jgi:hypothetical protein
VRVHPLLVAAPLLAASALAGAASDALRRAPRAPPGAASLLGGFSAIAVQALWLRASQAVSEFREDDAQVAFAAITELEPQLVSGGDFVARSIGFDLAEGHRDPAVRWSFGREGWRVLCRTVARNPDVARAYAARGRYELLRLAQDPAMRAGFERDVDPVGPMEHARRDYEEALRLRPQWREPWDGVAISSSVLAAERYERGDVDGAAKLWRRAREAFRRLVGMLAREVAPELVQDRDLMADHAEAAAALVELCAAPAAERAARLEALRGRFDDAWLPKQPSATRGR